ncbi:hypothetical protein G7068_04435 [Leucobacter viscericola]|uniref:Uncharacterized protein n=1 Tax=Leucobacter viscericola TaxID=2714935 RepID=A0A6G7XDI6_9MICO|nr:hypothetical protein [Leucobacter viscericola]QIK62536.1 hypothetical protein G7068_04435 [Leucobacter viscericola]
MRSLKAMLAVGASGLLLAGAASAATPALAVTDVGEIIDSCGSQTVCQFDGASITNAQALEGSLPDGVRVVVIPAPDQAETVPSSTIASQFKSATGAKTVIVIEDRSKDRFAVASDGDAKAITEELYSQSQTDGGLAVAAVEDTLASGDASPGADDDGGFGGALLGGILVIAACLVGAGAVYVLMRRRKGRSNSEHVAAMRLEKELAAALDGEDGKFIEDALEKLERSAAKYPDLGPLLMAMTQHVSELFVRVHNRGTDQQLRLLQAKYKDTLSKLLKAMNDDYYGDILANPQYWSNPEQRLAEVGMAIASVDQQAVENIRQVNESRDLEFKVALDSLIKTVNEAKLSDVYTDREE